MTPAVAVAVVSWNTRDLLRACLRSLSADADAGLADVWVIDNASSDGSAEIVESEFPWVSLIRSQENLGFGAAVNLVATRTRSPWIAAANADIELAPAALQSLLATAASSTSQAALFAPTLVAPDGTIEPSARRFPSATLSLVMYLSLHRLFNGIGDRLCFEGYWNPTKPREIHWAHGAFLLVKREPFVSVGGFDSRQFLFAEDIDLAWRLRRAGWTAHYVPDAVVRHVVAAATGKAYGSDRPLKAEAATYAWLARRRGRAAAWAFGVVNVGGATARLLLFASLAALSPKRWRKNRELARHHLLIHQFGLKHCSSVGNRISGAQRP